MLDLLNAPHLNILTLEEEIETRLPRVGQARLRPREGFTYARGLRTLLEQDPDVVMVGNIPDDETARLLATAAKRHLVLAGLETASPEAALARVPEAKVVVFHAPPHISGIQRLIVRP
jgi:type II secretory ATPase GspE/PulE/Tfp pilus assembly ATPase PilB-like protein